MNSLAEKIKSELDILNISQLRNYYRLELFLNILIAFVFYGFIASIINSEKYSENLQILFLIISIPIVFYIATNHHRKNKNNLALIPSVLMHLFFYFKIRKIKKISKNALNIIQQENFIKTFLSDLIQLKSDLNMNRFDAYEDFIFLQDRAMNIEDNFINKKHKLNLTEITSLYSKLEYLQKNQRLIFSKD